MKILIITDNLMKGGKERRLLELLRFFDLHEVKVKLVILKDLVEYPIVYQLKNTELIIFKRKIKKDPFIAFKILNLAKRFRPNIIHTWGSMPSVYALPTRILLKIPLLNAMIVNAKCDGKEKVRSILSFIFSDIILSNSKAGLKAYGVSGPKGRVIYNGFNFDRIENLMSPDIIREMYGISTRFVVGMVAAFHPRKDYETYLEVANDICQEMTNVTFLAIGDGPLKKELTLKYCHNNRIIFTGNINHVESVINLMDIGVLLSNPLNHLEGISNSILETMALGKPVVASRGGGTDEIVVNNENGFLIEPASRDKLKKALIDLLNDDNMRFNFGCNAQKHITRNFSIHQMCSQTLALYHHIIK